MNSALRAMKTLKKRKALYSAANMESTVRENQDQNRMDRMVAGLVNHNKTLNRVLLATESPQFTPKVSSIALLLSAQFKVIRGPQPKERGANCNK